MTKRSLRKFALLMLTMAAFGCLVNVINAQGPSKKDIKQAKQLVEQSNKAFNQKNYKAAIDGYAEAIVKVPTNPEAHFWKGYAHYYLKENDQALSELDTALAQKYKPLDVYKVRWFINYQKKNYDAALDDVKKGLELEPGNLMFLVGLGDLNYQKAAYPEALDAYQKALVVNPNLADLYYKIAMTQSNLGNIDGQASAAEEAVKRNTQFLGESYYLLGDAYQKQKKLPEAAAAFLHVLEARTDILAVYVNLAEIYRSEGRFNDAIDISKKGLRAFPGNGDIYTNLSWYYSLADRNDEAIQAANAGIQLSPDKRLAYTNLCRAYNDTKQYNLAINACNNALRITPNDGETNFYLGRANDSLGKKAEAAKFYERAVTGLIAFTHDNPEYSDGFYLLGNAYYYDDQVDKAIDAYSKCLQLSPRFAKARFNLGLTYTYKKNKAMAMEQYTSLLPLDSGLATKLKAEIDKL